MEIANNLDCNYCGGHLQTFLCGHICCCTCVYLVENLLAKANFPPSREASGCLVCNKEQEIPGLRAILENQRRISVCLREQMNAEILVVEERKERIGEEIRQLRLSVEEMLRKKENLILNGLNTMHEHLQLMLKDRLDQNEQIVQSLSCCLNHLPAMPVLPSRPAPSDNSLLENLKLLLKEHFQNLFSDSFTLRLERDERFRRSLSRLITLPVGQITIVKSDGETDTVLDSSDKTGMWKMTKTMEKFGSKSNQIINSWTLNKNPFTLSLENLIDGNQLQENQHKMSTLFLPSSSLENSTSDDTELTSPNSDSGHSSVFSFSGRVANNEITVPRILNGEIERRDSSRSPLSASKMVQCASAKFRSFIVSLRRASDSRLCNSDNRSHSTRSTPSGQRKERRLWSTPIKLGLTDFKCSLEDELSIGSKLITQSNESIAVKMDKSRTEQKEHSASDATEVYALQMEEPSFHPSDLLDKWMTSIPCSPNEIAIFPGRIGGEINCWLIDIAILPGSQYIVVFDAINKKLKKFEMSTGILSGSIGLDSEWSNVTVFSATKVAATLPECKQIVFVSIAGDFAIDHKVNTGRSYQGIAAIDEKYIVCSSYYEVCVDVLCPNGDLLISFNNSSLNDGELFFPCYLAATNDGNILVSDRVKKGLICLDISAASVKFSYYGPDDNPLIWPAGVAVDEAGYIYLADCFKSKIHTLTPTGEFDRILMTEADGLRMCRGLDVNDDGYLVTTDYRDWDIKVFMM